MRQNSGSERIITPHVTNPSPEILLIWRIRSLHDHDQILIGDGEEAFLIKLDISEAEKHGTITHCSSVYNSDNDTIQPGLSSKGPRIMNFADILKFILK